MEILIPSGETPLEAAAVSLNDPAERGRVSDAPITSVGKYPAPRQAPICYPGERPDWRAFTTAGDAVYPVRATETDGRVQFGVKTPEGVYDINDLLRLHGLLTMEERIPIVGFGSNANPGTLQEKFSAEQDKHGDIDDPYDREIVPTLSGYMKGVTPVYSSKLGLRGYIFAELQPEPGVQAEVSINFLSPGQLKRMIRSEGAYELCDMGEVSIDGLPRPIRAYGFVGKNNVLLDSQGKPIRLSTVQSTSELPAMSEEQVLEMVATEFGAQIDERFAAEGFSAQSAEDLVMLALYHIYLQAEQKRETQAGPGAASPTNPIGAYVQQLLQESGRISDKKMLDGLDAAKRNVEPRSFQELYRA